MMLDSSAVIAILQQESDAGRFADAIAGAAVRRIGAPTYLEICIVIAGRRGPRTLDRVEALIRDSKIVILPFTTASAGVAVDAFIRYGKGRHPAGLNFGDCISYAMAKTEVMPLLFKGDDFRLTDIEAAI